MIIVGKIISFEYKHALLCGQDNKGAGGGEGSKSRKRRMARENVTASARTNDLFFGTSGLGDGRNGPGMCHIIYSI